MTDTRSQLMADNGAAATVTRDRVTVTAVCRRCRQPFRSARRSRKFCSAACRQAGYRKRRKQSVHFRNDTPEWETPQAFFDEMDREFHFTLDVCATPENAKCQRYFTKTQDGLAQHWSGVCWMNPPYGRQIGRWVRKALDASRAGATVVCLVPARTDTTWWHLAAENGAEIRFLRGRLRFGGMAHNAPFPSAIVIFRPLRIVEGVGQ